MKERYDVLDNIKLVLFVESFLPEFDQQKAYILANQNITLKKTIISLTSNEVQILKDYATMLEIEVITTIAKMK